MQSLTQVSLIIGPKWLETILTGEMITQKNLTQSNLADLMDNKHISWKTYQEDYPDSGCFVGEAHGQYQRKHNPFISFTSISENATRCANIVPSRQLDIDLKDGRLPQYSFYTPDMQNDGHDTTISFAGTYLATFFKDRLAQFPAGTLIVVTWDEDWYRDSNRVYTILLGSMIPPNATDSTPYTHYSLLRTCEDNWDLGTLNRFDNTAIPFTLAQWAPPTTTPTLSPTGTPVSTQPPTDTSPPTTDSPTTPTPDNSYLALIIAGISVFLIIIVILVSLFFLVPSFKEKILSFLDDCFGIRYPAVEKASESQYSIQQNEEGIDDVMDLDLDSSSSSN